MSHPTSHHLVAAKRILRYIKGSLHMGIHFLKGSLALSVHSNTNWAGDPIERRSITGMVVFLVPVCFHILSPKSAF